MNQIWYMKHSKFWNLAAQFFLDNQSVLFFHKQTWKQFLMAYHGLQWITDSKYLMASVFFFDRNFDQRTQKIRKKTFQSHVYYSTFLLRKYRFWRVIWSYPQYCQTSNVRCTLIGNKIVDHSDVVGALPVGAAPKYIFILNLTFGFNGLDKDSCKTRWETFKFWDLMWLILKIWQCVNRDSNLPQSLLLQINPVYMDTACGLHNYLVYWSITSWNEAVFLQSNVIII